jgi:hypothetical protein
LKCTVDDFAGALGDVDLQHAFGKVSKSLREVYFLEGPPVPVLARDLTDEQHHRRGILLRRVQPDAGMRKAGTATPARPESLPLASAMFAAAASWRQVTTCMSPRAS